MRKHAKQALSLVQSANLYLDEFGLKPRFFRNSPQLFNLDLHISVIADLKSEFAARRIGLTNWSISGSNRFMRNFFRLSDPVKYVNSSSWTFLSEKLIDDFNGRYGRFLSRFDGFVVTHTPAFAQLFENMNKPILVLASTRYEAPYTNRPQEWGRLNHSLISGFKAGTILLAANNLGDRDYLRYFLEIEPHYAPSFCNYTKYNWRPNAGVKLVLSRSDSFARKICKMTGDFWIPFREFMGSKYSWSKFDNVSEVLIIPYNVSTMSYFEFATAGIPVVVPSKKFLNKLVKDSSSVLSELSFFQINNLEVSSLANDNPNNYSSKTFYDWWLDRSDFYQPALMPNVRQIDSFEELLQPTEYVGAAELRARNLRVLSQRSSLIQKFVEML